MYHREETIAAALAEPPDGTKLIVETEDPREFKVIWRDDAAAKRWGAHPQDRWFSDDDSDPMGFYQHVKYASAVFAIGERLVAFHDNDAVVP